MKNYIKSIKEVYKLTGIKKKIIYTYFIIALISNSLTYLIAIPAAKVLDYIKDADYNKAYLFVAISFLILALKIIFIYLRSWFGNILFGKSFKNVISKIYDKLYTTKSSEIRNFSQEKIVNVLDTDVEIVSNLFLYISIKMANLIVLIITIIYVSTINIYIVIALLIAIIINFKAIEIINNKRAVNEKNNKEVKEEYIKSFFEILENRKDIKKFNNEKIAYEKFNKDLNNYTIGTRKRWYYLNSIRDNWHHLLYQLLISLITTGLIFLISNNSIDLVMYLILVPFADSIIKNSSDILEITFNIKFTEISRKRITKLLNFSKLDLIDYGTNNKDDIKGKIEFKNVSYVNKDKSSIFYGKLRKISFNIKEGSITTIKGFTQSGKRQIFYLLSRIIKPDSGQILLDNTNIYEYNKETYISNFNYVTYKPKFINGSIKDNLMLSKSSKKEMVNICEKLKINEFILSLPNKYNTNINLEKNLFTDEKLFLIGLARALLSKSEVIAIYEFPVSFDNSKEINLNELLLDLKKDKTILIFISNDKTYDISDQVIEIKNGKIILN